MSPHPQQAPPGYDYDPLRRGLIVAEPRLTRLLQREPESCASVSEYATRTGLSTEHITTLIGPALDGGVLALEVAGGDLFVHTAPAGRPTPKHLPDVAPNLWERLRSHGNVDEAYSLWRIFRALESAGWHAEANPNRIMFELGAMPQMPPMGVHIGAGCMPLVIHPSPEHIAHPQGFLSMYEQATAHLVGVLCDSGALDDMVTAVRRWGLPRRGETRMGVIVLEAPRYAPVLLRPGDASVIPQALSRAALTAGTGLG